MNGSQGKGRFYTLNFPLKDGVTDETYVYIFEKYVLLSFFYIGLPKLIRY